jgi:multimeric flavodoxin WrbA
MRVMTILGSPRREGNTATVLGWMEDRWRDDGHDIDSANMLDYKVDGCCECLACKKGTVELCSIGDDANDLYRRMAAADLVLIAAPVFCWGFPAQIKGLIDRMYCMMDFAVRRPDAPRLQNKPMGLLLTGGGGEADNAELVVGAFQRLVEYLGCRMGGHLFVGGCTTPEKLTSEAKARAADFAAKVGEKAVSVKSCRGENCERK